MTTSEPDTVVGLGKFAVAKGTGTLAALGLGSCVAVVMHDSGVTAGGLVHVVLPSQSLSHDRTNPARFAETAVPLLLGEMERIGADRHRITARLVGGASMFGSLRHAGTVNMGDRNLVACRLALRSAGLRVSAELVGGAFGRSVWLEVATGIVTVRRVGHEPETL